jgi:hypothetical protein
LAAWRQLHARTVPEVVKVDVTPIASTSAGRLTLGFRDLHIHLDGVPDAAQVAVIRQALNGRTDHP